MNPPALKEKFLKIELDFPPPFAIYYHVMLSDPKLRQAQKRKNLLFIK